MVMNNALKKGGRNCVTFSALYRRTYQKQNKGEGFISVSMTAVKSQWGGLETAAPPASVSGKQRGVLLLSLLHQPWMSVHRALMFRVGLPSRLRQCRNSLKESLLDPVKSAVSTIFIGFLIIYR